MTIRFADAATINGTRLTNDGYLVTTASVARTGVQPYTGKEMGIEDKDIVMVYRPEDEVRAPASLSTYSHAPVTIGHPDKVTADNWKDLAKGEVSTEAVWDGNTIRLPLVIKDAQAIDAIQSGLRELSAGYTCQLEMKAGVTPDGVAYDAVQRNIRINHVAIVPHARAGRECRIGDADNWAHALNWGDAAPTTFKKEDSMSDALKTVVLGDKAVQVLLADVATIEAFKVEAKNSLDTVIAANDAAIATKDAEIATKDAELDKLRKQVMSDEQLDARVQARSELVSTAHAIAPDVEVKGLSDADVRKAVVTHVLGDEAIKGKSDAYVEARFDVMAEDHKDEPTDKFADAMSASATPRSAASATEADKAYMESITEVSDAWKGLVEKGA